VAFAELQQVERKDVLSLKYASPPIRPEPAILSFETLRSRWRRCPPRATFPSAVQRAVEGETIQ
jgi:hypothetical protein